MKIAISRTDNIGDVMLSLPMAGLLKQVMPNATIAWIGKTYTRDLIAACRHVDEFYDIGELTANPDLLRNARPDAIVHVFPHRELAKIAAEAHIPLRIGTSHRWFHWLYCNRLVHLGRKNSPLHEAQLNIRLLKPLLGKDLIVPLQEIAGLYGFSAPDLPIAHLPEKPFVILHPKSKGSAREWPVADYLNLAQLLEKQGIDCAVTGTAAEGDTIRQSCPELLRQANVHDFTGKLSLAQLIALIEKSSGLVACSTGPLHIAAALGKPAIGIYPPMRPIHPGRWAPVGTRAEVLVLNKNCQACKRSGNCACIAAIRPDSVLAALNRSMY
jgi:ADP-heptose:LPS heptosyltransferase